MERTLSKESVVTNTIVHKPARVLPAWLPERWHVHVFLWMTCFILGLPIIYALLVSTQTNAEVFAYKFTFGSSLLSNWNVVLSRQLTSYIANTVLIALLITTGKTLVSLLAGLAFVYFRFPGKWIVFGFVLITLMMPTEILIMGLLRLVNDLGWGSTYLALVVPFLASATGTFLFRQHFANIPAELSEAAQLDGVTPFGFLFRVLIPLSWNAIGALAVIQFIYVWNMYLWPVLVMHKRELQVVQVGLQSLVSTDQSTSYGPAMLGAIVASIPPVLVFILLQKQFMGGFALSRDK